MVASMLLDPFVFRTLIQLPVDCQIPDPFVFHCIIYYGTIMQLGTLRNNECWQVLMLLCCGVLKLGFRVSVVQWLPFFTPEP